MKTFNDGAAGADIAVVAFKKFEAAWEVCRSRWVKFFTLSLKASRSYKNESFNLAVSANKVSGGDGLLGFQHQNKEVMGWQEALIARGTLTRSEINALITDSVKDVEGEVYNAIGRININPTNAESIYDKLFDKVLAYEEKIKDRGSFTDNETAKAKALLKAEEERLKALALSNEELKRSESLALAQARALYGPETQKIIEAQIKLGQAQREAALFKDKTQRKQKTRQVRSWLQRRGTVIRDAYRDARDAAIDAADALGEARGKRAQQLFGKIRASTSSFVAQLWCSAREHPATESRVKTLV